MNPRVVGGRALLFAVATCLAACVHLGDSPPPLEVRTYHLDYAPPGATSARLPVVLQLAGFGVASAYDRESIVYREGSNAVAAYFYHRWSAGPGRMFSDLFARDLVASQQYRSVQQGVSPIPADYRISGDIEEIDERPGDSGCVAHLRMRLAVVPAAGKPGDAPLFQQPYVEDEPVACNDPPALVGAMSRAAERVSTRFRDDLSNAVRRAGRESRRR